MSVLAEQPVNQKAARNFKADLGIASYILKLIPTSPPQASSSGGKKWEIEDLGIYAGNFLNRLSSRLDRIILCIYLHNRRDPLTLATLRSW